jgi:FAD/FMN-containing dehydrogenase/Fe-S oxidoreductase
VTRITHEAVSTHTIATERPESDGSPATREARSLPAPAVRELESVLRARVAGEVDFSTAARALYATDASNYRQTPLGVVFPRTTEDAIKTVKTCQDFEAAILPRGAGTSLAGQCCNAAVIIDMSRHLRRILTIDPDRKTARVQPGVVLDDLQHVLAPHHLMYGPDPATHAWCTFGGMIGNNSCGVHSVIAGMTADAVQELEILTSDGVRLTVGQTPADVLETRCREQGRVGEIYRGLRALSDRYAPEIRARYPQIPRRVSGFNLEALLPERGFDLARALVGSEGTCVTVLEALVRLIERPRHRSLLVLGFPDIVRAADEIMAILEARPIGLEAIDDVLVRNLRKKQQLPRELDLLPDGEAWLLVEFGAETAREAESAARDLHHRLRQHGSAMSGKVLTDPHETEMVWRVRESGLGATAFVPGERATWEGWEDAAVPPERLGPYLRDYRRLLRRHHYSGALYGHFGQGCVHTRTNFDLETPAGIARFRRFIHEAADLVVQYGGSLSGEHGDGQARGELLYKMFGDSLVRAFREFKTIFDPAGLMNPGKVVDAYAATDHLRRPGYQPAAPRTFFQFAHEGGFAGAGLRCVGVGKCRKTDEGTMCPSYMVTRDEQHSTRGRARLLFEMLRGETIQSGWDSAEVKHALDLCLACKACKSECPVNVDMASYKAEFLAHHYDRRSRPLRAHLFGHVDWWAHIAARTPRLVNAMAAARPLTRVLQSAVGIAPERRLPRFARETFQAWMRRHPPRSEGQPLVLWSDTFTNYFYPEVGRAAVAILERLGYRIIVPRQTCCGRPLYDFGLLDSAREYLEGVFRVLGEPIGSDVPIVMLEPSCFAVFRDEALNLCGDQPSTRRIAQRTQLFSTFMRPHLERGELPSRSTRALVHVHCHQRAMVGVEDTAAAATAAGVNAELPDAGCCGMAGSFGFDKDHYTVSMQVGERVLLPAVRQANEDTIIMADGFSCREQIRHATGRRAYHFAEVLERIGTTP